MEGRAARGRRRRRRHRGERLTCAAPSPAAPAGSPPGPAAASTSSRPWPACRRRSAARAMRTSRPQRGSSPDCWGAERSSVLGCWPGVYQRRHREGMTMPLPDAPSILRAAREDAGLTQRALAESVGARQPHIAAIESGRRPVSPELLGRLLTAADYRPSLALATQRDPLISLGRKHGISEIRVFGSVARATDRPSAGIASRVTLGQRAAPLGFAAFVAEATELLGCPVAVVRGGDDGQPLIRCSAVRL